MIIKSLRYAAGESSPAAKERRSSFLLFLTAVIWGVAFVAQRTGMDYMEAFTFNGVRFLLGGLVLIPVSYWLEHRSKDHLDEHAKKIRITTQAGIIGGLVLFVGAGLQQLGVQITMSAGKAGFITGLYIVLTPVLGMFIGKKTRAGTWVGAGLACIGLYFLSAPEGLSSIGLGDMALIACAFFWAAHILVIDHYTERIYPVRFSIIQFFVCAALSLVCAFMFEPVTVSAIVNGRVPLLYSSLLSVGVAYVLQIVGQRHVEPAKAALIFSMESLFAAIGAAILINEILNTRSYVGCGFIFAGILASQIKKRNTIHK